MGNHFVADVPDGVEITDWTIRVGGEARPPDARDTLLRKLSEADCIVGVPEITVISLSRFIINK